jgi:hypothetical protein
MAIPNGTGASWFELGELTLIEPTSAPNTPELANTFIYRPRGPQSSEGWFLTTRHDLELWHPELLPDDLLSTADQSTFKNQGWNKEPITLKVKNKPASFGVVDSSLETDIQINHLYLESAYVLPEFSSGVPANYERSGVDRSNFTYQETEANNSWNMQLCLVHVVDIRWYRQHGSTISKIDHFSPRPFLLKGESFGEEDTIHYNTNINSVQSDVNLFIGDYSELFTALEKTGGGITDTVKTDAGFPTVCRNYNLTGLPSYECYWEILNEISHTVVYNCYEGASTIAKIVPKGSDDSTTATERTNFKNLGMLYRASHNMYPKKGTINYEVLFPEESGNPTGWRTDFSHTTTPEAVGVNGILTGLRPRNAGNSYISITIAMDSSVSDTGTLYSHDSMTSIYGSNRIPSAGSPLDSSNQIKGRLLARSNYLTGSAWSNVSNQSELVTHAKELATLRAKEFHYQNNGKNFFNETYLGFLNFTPTKDLSAIIWSDTGAGAITKIANRPFDKDHETYTESPNFIHPKSVNSIEINEFPPDNFYGDFRQLGYVLSGDTRKDFYASEEVFISGLSLTHPNTPQSITDDGSGGSSTIPIEVRNKTKYPLFNSYSHETDISGPHLNVIESDTLVEIFWNREAEEWWTLTSPHTLAGKAGIVSGMSGNTPGSGSMTIYYVSPANVWTTTNIDVSFINIATATVSSGTNITIKRLGQSNVWVLDMEACS